jgi:hypothetical protein
MLILLLPDLLDFNSIEKMWAQVKPYWGGSSKSVGRCVVDGNQRSFPEDDGRRLP